MTVHIPPEPERGRDPLVVWTIYDHPKDFPEFFVVRPHRVMADGIVEAGEGYACPDIEVLREHMRQMGLVCLDRHPTDDPVIVETWI